MAAIDAEVAFGRKLPHVVVFLLGSRALIEAYGFAYVVDAVGAGTDAAYLESQHSELLTQVDSRTSMILEQNTQMLQSNVVEGKQTLASEKKMQHE